MTPTRHQQLMELFDRACDLPPPEQAALLERLAHDDPELGRALTRLLHHDRAPLDGLDAGAVPRGALLAGVPDALELPGLPDLEVLSILAEGGMGRVLLARQRSLQREVAIKTVRDRGDAALLAEGLRTEARLAGALEHPNIVPIHLLEHDPQGLPVLVMKRVEGVSWAELIDRPEHPLWAQLAAHDPLEGHLQILVSVCNALHFAHSRGILHRDVKPDNVMVGSFGEVYLLDWGIAAPAATGDDRAASPPAPPAIIGTPGYLPPEMAAPAGRCCDARTDVYLLGATLHHALTGRPRHEGRGLDEVLAAARRSAPVAYDPAIPEELAALCNRATHADPAQRFPSAAALRDALLDFHRHRGAVALCEDASEPLRQVQALFGRGPAGATSPPADDSSALHGRARSLIEQAQFGFQASLRAWPDYARAAAGLRECLIVATEHELLMDNLPGARALLRQIADPPADLAARVAALHERVQAQRARDARLAAIERSQDWTTGELPRLLAMLAAMGLAVWLWRAVVTGPRPLRPALLAQAMAGMLAGTSLLVLLWRRSLLQTEVNRRITLGFLCCLGGMTASRALSVLPAPETAVILSTDQVLAATVAAVGGVVLARWLWLLVPVLLGGALVERLAPAPDGVTMIVSTGAALGISVLCLWRARRSAARSC